MTEAEKAAEDYIIQAINPIELDKRLDAAIKDHNFFDVYECTDELEIAAFLAGIEWHKKHVLEKAKAEVETVRFDLSHPELGADFPLNGWVSGETEIIRMKDLEEICK